MALGRSRRSGRDREQRRSQRENRNREPQQLRRETHRPELSAEGRVPQPPIYLASENRSVLTAAPGHETLGIFCLAPSSNRNLLDFISEAVDPTTGFAHIAYADDNKVNKLRVANQVSGPSILKP
jgi:hypothetical protein